MAGNLEGTTTLSSLSLTGTLSSQTNVTSALSLTGTGNVSAGSLSVGGGTSFIKSTATRFTVVATTVAATKSTTTTYTITGLTADGALYASVATFSGLSNGVTMDVWCSAADTITISYSNVSTVAANQIATPINIAAWRFA